MQAPSLSTLRIAVNGETHVGELILARPDALNAMSMKFFDEFDVAMLWLEQSDAVNVILVWAEGRLFTAGLDLKELGNLVEQGGDDSRGAVAVRLYKKIKSLQSGFARLHTCLKPTIVAVHNRCLGGGVDLVTSCDIRFCTSDALFAILETKLAVTADLGTLQRIGRIVGPGVARELAFSADAIAAQRAREVGLVNKVFDTKEAMLAEARAYAARVAAQSPLVVQSTKGMLNFAEDHSVEEGLNHVALWNAAFLQSEDLMEAVGAHFQRRAPVFRNRL